VAYDALAVSNYLLDLAVRDGNKINPMKMQKLVYNAHGLCLAIYDRPLIDESVQAWAYGPVVPSLYHEFKRYGSGDISAKATKVDFSGPGRFSYQILTPTINDGCDGPQSKAQTMDLLEAVWEAFGNLSAIQLSNLTHQPGTPWSVTVAKYPGKKGVEIPDELMKEWFAGRTATPPPK
jgi:uncharacterized phage-associated protein